MSESDNLVMSEDEFEIVETSLPYRTRSKVGGPTSQSSLSLHLRNIPQTDQILLSIQPPEKPPGELKHSPCDIVLVIDVSGSMHAAAELPDQANSAEKEDTGLSILDLVKHAARTIIEKLDERDRLAVVTFSTHAKVIQGLQRMTEREKGATWERIQKLKVHDSTNLWAGIREGLTVIEETERVGNVQGMFILTDGHPNYMCPSQGYVKKLQPMLKRMRDDTGSAPTLSTFGFGYILRSALLRSIAEVGGGSYAFIPDAGMIGTVFVHAVANLFSTFATDAVVNLSCSRAHALITLPSYLAFDSEDQKADTRQLRLGNLQYGQSRDIILTVDHTGNKDGCLKAGLSCWVPGGNVQTTEAKCNLATSATALSKSLKYHLFRNELCEFLSALCGKNANNEYVTLPSDVVESKQAILLDLTNTIEGYLGKSKSSSDDETRISIAALLADLKSANPDDPHGSGQIALALSVTPPDADSASPRFRHNPHNPQSYYTRWGSHYLPGILHAHMRQLCTTFKDPGPLRYGMKSPLFAKCRGELDEAFDNLPPPEPSRKVELHHQVRGEAAPGHATRRGHFSMSRYNMSSNPCFDGECNVLMASEEDNIKGMKVHEVRVGDFVWTPAGGRMIREIVKTDVGEQGQDMCYFPGTTGLWITPWHPIRVQGSWKFPNTVCENTGGSSKVQRNGSVYSIMLDKDEDTNAHIIDVGGVHCVTLGHGLVTEISTDADVRTHAFFGDYDLISKNLAVLEKDECGRRICGGIVKVNINTSVEVSQVACAFMGPATDGKALAGAKARAEWARL